MLLVTCSTADALDKETWCYVGMDSFNKAAQERTNYLTETTSQQKH